MRLPRARRATAGIGAIVIVVLATMLLAGCGAAARASSRPVSASDANRKPWYGLTVLRDHIAFTGAPTAAGPPITASSGILVDIDTGQILWQHEPHRRLAPASTIKLLTSMVVLENFAPTRLITATPEALFAGTDETTMHIDPGEKLTVQELMTGLLMVSANDAANVLATETVGMEKFVAAMNAQAQAVGLQDTHATSPVGLDDDNMYSSAYDLAVLATLDYTHWQLFRDIVDTQQTVLPASALHSEFELTNVDQLLQLYPAAVGIKTGYTGNAGNCLVGLAVRDGHRLLSVLMNEPDYIFATSRTLLDWGFTQEGLPTQYPTPTPKPTPAPSPSLAAATPAAHT
ncbi:MAG: D-alanyl-D-alanine carboxypeptidase [Candidatus Dormibacteraeota bacterium]|nr:D-alanyl-D-alanine carboxypeptidase [Candidatus Dormibacteraeota bacterium]